MERDTLRAPALSERLAAALANLLGTALTLEVLAGAPGDSPARREAAERARRQRQAEQRIDVDPLVQELLSSFQGASIVPGSIKPL